MIWDNDSIDDSDVRRRPWWQSFLESSGGAAFITVLIGGLLAQWINMYIQDATSTREFNNAWLKARGDQALAAYKDYVTEQLKVADGLFTSVGSIVAAAEALVASAGWNRSHPDTDERVRNIAVAFNTAEDDWVKSQRRLAFLMSYYGNSEPKVVERWKSLQGAVDGYRECVSTWYDKFDGKSSYSPEAICRTQKNGVDRTLSELADAMEHGRAYLWLGWNNPDTLRKALRSGG